jgi:dsDNA-binding SOS-regulon protein
MSDFSRKEADAYDRLIDAAGYLADLLEQCEVDMDEYVLEEVAIFLAKNANYIRGLLKPLKVTFKEGSLSGPER